MRVTETYVDRRPVAWVRSFLGLATVLNALEAYALLSGIAGGKLAMPVVSWMPAPTQHLLTIYLVAAILAGVAVMVGLHVAAASIVSTALGVVVLMWDQQTYSSHRLLATLMVAYLVFAGSERRGSAGTGRLVPWWPQLLMMSQLSVCYLFAAASKINPMFLGGDVLRVTLRWALPGDPYAALAVAAVLTEFLLAFGLWFAATRRVAAALGVCLHLSIVIGMPDQPIQLVSFAMTCVPVYALFLSRPPLGGAGVQPQDHVGETLGPSPLDGARVAGRSGPPLDQR